MTQRSMQHTFTLAVTAPVEVELRDFIRTALVSLHGAALHDVVVLLTSELVTNAVEAGSHTVEVTVGYDGTYLRVAVVDDAPGVPRLRRPMALDERGRGLVLVDQLASAWGWRPVLDGKETWFE